MAIDRTATRNEVRARAGARRGAAARVVLAIVVAGCAAAPPAEPQGLVDDFDAPRPRLVASLLDSAAYRESRHDLDGALRNAERAHAAAPQSGAAALREAELSAWVAIRASDDTGLALARDAIREIMALHPEAPLPRLADARLELAVGDRKKAAEAATALIAERPDSAAANALLSRALLEEDPRRARDLARRAVELSPSDPDALAARALALAAFADFHGASVDARSALRFRPDRDLTEILVVARLRAGDPRGAIREVETLLEAERTVTLEILFAKAKGRLEDYDGTEAALVRAKTLAGDDAAKQVEAIEASVFVAILRGKPGEALAEVQAARALGPDDPTLAELEARAKSALGRHAEAEVDARRALDLDPQSLSAWHTLARVLDEAGVRPPAFERARAAVGGGVAGGHALAGRIAEQKGDDEGALREYEAALAADPGLAFAQLGVAGHSLKKDAPRALALAERAQAALGWSISTARALGVALYENGRAAEAIDVLEIGIGRSDPAPGAALPLEVALAFALDKAGKPEPALRMSRALRRTGRQMDPTPDWLASVEALEAKLDPEKKPAAREEKLDAPAKETRDARAEAAGASEPGNPEPTGPEKPTANPKTPDAEGQGGPPAPR